MTTKYRPDDGGQTIYLQGGMDDALIGWVPLIPTSVPRSSRKSAEPSALNSAFSEHLSQWCRIGRSPGFESSTKWWPLKSAIIPLIFG